MYCPKCLKLIADDVTFCPHCGYDTRKGYAGVARKQTPKYKFPVWATVLIIVVAAVIVLPMVSQISAGYNSAKASHEYMESVQNPAEANRTYTEYNVTELFDDLDANALRAEQAHQNEYVTVVGYIRNFDSDGKYFSIDAGKDDMSYLFDTIRCDIQTESLRQKVLTYDKYDKVTVTGQITSIGEIMGYAMTVYEIN